MENQYGIVLGKTCLTMIKNGMNTDCPTYEQLNAVFPDNTNPNVSGSFDYIDGIWQRDQAPMLKPWNYYKYDTKPTMWIDPPNDTRDKINLIIIEPKIPEYKLKTLQVMPNYEIEFGHDRYVTVDCSSATITAENWLYLAGDSLRYLQHNCDPAFTNFDHIVKHKFEKSYQDLATSNKWKLDEFIKNAKEKYKVSYIGSNEVIENKAVTEDEDQ